MDDVTLLNNFSFAFRYMFGLCTNEDKHYMYGFMDCQLINPLRERKVDTQTKITNYIIGEGGGNKYILHHIFTSKCSF